MSRAAKAATDIRIAPHRSVVIDGRARGAGEVVGVPDDEAQILISEGYAVPASEPVPKAPKRAGARVKQAPRRPLTPKAIDNGEEERGG